MVQTYRRLSSTRRDPYAAYLQSDQASLAMVQSDDESFQDCSEGIASYISSNTTPVKQIFRNNIIHVILKALWILIWTYYAQCIYGNLTFLHSNCKFVRVLIPFWAFMLIYAYSWAHQWRHSRIRCSIMVGLCIKCHWVPFMYMYISQLKSRSCVIKEPLRILHCWTSGPTFIISLLRIVSFPLVKNLEILHCRLILFNK